VIPANAGIGIVGVIVVVLAVVAILTSSDALSQTEPC
jgi:hypothetical protein